MFSNDKTAEKILNELRDLKREVAELQGEKDAAMNQTKLAKEGTDLRRDIETLKIERDRLTETHEREQREVKHMVGLEKRRAEQEKDMAIREAKLGVRESAVDSKVQAFTEKLEFVQEQLTEQITYLKDDIIKEVFKRLPVVEVNKTVTLNGDGPKSKAGAR